MRDGGAGAFLIAWVVFLLGAEVSFAVQTSRHYQWRSFPLTPTARLAMAYDIMEKIISDYRERNVTNLEVLAQLVNQSETIGTIVKDLVNGGLLRHVEDKQEGYVPAAPLTKIKPSEVMDLILGKDHPAVQGCDLTSKALEAARSSLDRYDLNCQERKPADSVQTEEQDRGTS